jgi:hypothetical protein
MPMLRTLTLLTPLAVLTASAIPLLAAVCPPVQGWVAPGAQPEIGAVEVAAVIRDGQGRTWERLFDLAVLPTAGVPAVIRVAGEPMAGETTPLALTVVNLGTRVNLYKSRRSFPTHRAIIGSEPCL